MTLRPIPHALALAGAITLLAACGGGGSDVAVSAAAGTSRAQAVPSAGLPPAPAGLSGNVTCRNFAIGAVALDTVIVPANAACTLEGTRLTGSVLVGQGATLQAIAIDANGGVQAEGAAHVALTGNSRITGAVQIKQGGSASIRGNRLEGDLQVDAMRGDVRISDNQVGGSIQAVGNRGGVAVTGNVAKGNLQCKENSPAPTASGNAAAQIEDQCIGSAGGGSGGSGGGGSAPVLSGNVTCAGLRIGTVSLDSVIVPAGASCTLDGTQLKGSLEVGPGASASATDVRVTGNVKGEGAASVTIGGRSTVGGSVQLKQGGIATVVGATISGDLQIDAMTGPIVASGNGINGNLQAIGNRGDLNLTANTIGGAMQCKENAPAPTGSGNVATIKEDQCRLL